MVTALILVLAFTFVACGGSGQQVDQRILIQVSRTRSKTRSRNREMTLHLQAKICAIVYPVIHQFFDPVTQGAEAYAKELGDVGVYTSTRRWTGSQQIEIMEPISMKVDILQLIY